jgi:hypothetical protein
LARLAITATAVWTDAESDAFEFIVGIHEILNVVISSGFDTLRLLITSI